jgi:hypothetical protein
MSISHAATRQEDVSRDEARRRLGQVYLLLISLATQKRAAGRVTVSEANTRPAANCIPHEGVDANGGHENVHAG